MNTKKFLSIAFGLIVTCSAFMPVARASEFNQSTKVTFDQPIEIPGQVLPAGTYWFVLADNDLDRYVVRIFSADWKTLYATEMTANSERLKPADGTILTFAERESSGNKALVSWFYPGETIGHEFLYSGQEAKELARDKRQKVVATRMSTAELKAGM
jgi:hypothetical protein